MSKYGRHPTGSIMRFSMRNGQFRNDHPDVVVKLERQDVELSEAKSCSIDGILTRLFFVLKTKINDAGVLAIEVVKAFVDLELANIAAMATDSERSGFAAGFLVFFYSPFASLITNDGGFYYKVWGAKRKAISRIEIQETFMVHYNKDGPIPQLATS
ncbi:hypothetical protein NHQ30_009341 [Ciborinia camelliae]|nr:hypothetical protein NHQ30_009341 [Ciborinia camelliae]